MREFQFFNPRQEFSIASKNLPHWAQAGTMAFITWRAADSLPVAVIKQFAGEKAILLKQFGLDPNGDWKQQLAQLPAEVRGSFHWSIFENWDRQLDLGAGACVLAETALSQIVADSLLHFDEDRYLLTDFVVMPNHVHVLAAFATENTMSKQITSWKRFTGGQINKSLANRGEFWQVEQFDHLVRSAEQFEHYRRYIADNPGKARLPSGSYRWFSKNLHSTAT
jgi:REP element-mobilizing transposase RayT